MLGDSGSADFDPDCVVTVRSVCSLDLAIFTTDVCLSAYSVVIYLFCDMFEFSHVNLVVWYLLMLHSGTLI